MTIVCSGRLSVFETLDSRSPRFYQNVLNWFRTRRRRCGWGCGRAGSSGDQFPTEKHSNLKHRAVATTAQHSTSSNTKEPLTRAKLCSTQSNASRGSSLQPRLDTLESGYQSNSPASSPATPRSRVIGGPLSPWRKVTSGRLKLLKRKFKFGAGSLSEEIPDPDPQILEG